MTPGRREPLRPAVSRGDRLVIMVTVLAASVFPVDLQPGTQVETRGASGQLRAKQGQILLLPVSVDGSTAELTGRFIGRRISFFRDHGSGPSGTYFGLVGVDMQDSPGLHELVVELHATDGVRRLSYNVLVTQELFPVQHLTLPKHMVELDHKSLVRVKAEQQEVREVLSLASDERLWAGPFMAPVEGAISGAFGRKRVINGQRRSPHSGEDIGAPMGTEVVATNDGVVRSIVDHFFSGKGVFVDHGLGLLSMYFHLSEVLVGEGEAVRQGQVIGKVGASGRATGPHLHWGIRLNGARVDPYALVTLPLGEAAPSGAGAGEGLRTED